jgi:hypothetical protein
VLILQIFVFGNYLFFTRGSYICLLPCSIICLISGVKLFKIYKKYDDVKFFFEKLDVMYVKDIIFYLKIYFRFPRASLELEDNNGNNSQHECIICTEILTKARRLTCNHYFHL